MEIFIRYTFTIVLAMIGLFAVIIPSAKKVVRIIRLRQIGHTCTGIVIERAETGSQYIERGETDSQYLIKTFIYKIKYEDSSGNTQFLDIDDPVLKKYEVGSEFKVIYDPTHPSRAIVENSSTYISLALRIIVSFLIFYIIVYTLISIPST